MTDNIQSKAQAARPAGTSGRIVLTEVVDARMLMLVRCVLAFSALAVVCIDASQPQTWVRLTQVSLALYCVYSAVLAARAARAGWPQPNRVQHWVDVFFYIYLVTLTDGTSSIFFSFFLFSILVASFTWGFGEGLRVSVVSLTGFIAVGMAVGPADLDFELNRALIRAVYLFVFGYMISYWGGYERLLKRRLALLNEINNTWNPRFGVDHAISANLDRLLDFYQAQSCVLILKRPGAPCAAMYRGSPGKSAAASAPISVIEKASVPLLGLPPTFAAFYYAPDGPRHLRWRDYAGFDAATKNHAANHRAECAALANLLDARTFITVPYAQRDGTLGRLFVVDAKRGTGQSDIAFLHQVASAVATVVENIALMEELISRASEQERLKISRDLHDTTIQPYIGLKLALDALLREATPDNPLSSRLGELADMAGMTVRDLRDYAENIKEKASMPGEFLLNAMREKVKRMQRFYGIEVMLGVDISDKLDGRLAAETFHLVSEGLSNILRHTSAKRAFVTIACEGPELKIVIANETPENGESGQAFTPRSIYDRTAALGGATLVESDTGGYTVVRISIPLQ